MTSGKPKRKWWTISVSGYGSFQHFGTEAEAEDMRSHKAAWEGGRGRKRPATTDEMVEAKDFLEWQRDHGYPMDERQQEALR